MAFWGVEVKPGKPFTHIADNARDRLHISQATLGTGNATKKSVVQCNVGNKSPVFLCSLFPEKAESCQLNLEFEEANEVVFSVIGPRSVHLTGYFLGSGGRHYNLNDESESYGEDIADTETERSTGRSDEDKYEDSFIDDSDPKLFPPSPLSGDKVQEFEVTPDKRKPKNVKDSHKRLRKKYQLSETDDDVGAQEHTNANDTTALDSESEDMLPISSLCKGSPATRTGKLEAEERIEKNRDTNPATENGKFEAEEKPDKKRCETINCDTKEEHYFTIMERKVDAVDNAEPKRPNSGDFVLPAVVVIPENGAKPKKKKKARSKGVKDINTDGCCNVLEEDKAKQNDAEADKKVQNLSLGNEENEKTSNYDADLPPDSMPASTQMGPESDAKPKKRKRKDHAEKSFEADSNYHTNVTIEDSALQDEVKPNSMDQDLPVRNEQNEKQANDKISDNDVQSAGENPSEEKKKKKKKRKTNEDGKITDMEISLLSRDEKSGLVTDTEKSSDSKLSQLRTLSNEVVIEELEKGQSDGKVATSGKKISVLYTGKLKENGQVFDSNLDGTPFKFRLGGKDVLDCFNVGLEGMRVGEKRRIFVPPSMGYGSEGDGKNVPPNSSLVFDMELVKVHK
ncbi:peptidyl-prolyl cis-trans isomerase FKBP43-like isoform X2 [Pistacia vera]|uniref:peptidyl-prolyl cis-trans isomerase FKBP43-like isoform X2 n=1 Tax=Pistacia vera TaxID=55513 RepID=UPI00126320F4|nr:peptidyl-prolyl cis-trans isomerase FKBP43-like isoform X2 [Pistacia vera]